VLLTSNSLLFLATLSIRIKPHCHGPSNARALSGAVPVGANGADCIFFVLARKGALRLYNLTFKFTPCSRGNFHVAMGTFTDSTVHVGS